ncbi:MAG TPA: hypothetical protein VH025_00110 [Solirubrobacteraceae bacterium]|jgi:hypothetical protein|nr:hypothetical protein [Solirubrobacteraceae bacterium]
MPHHYALHGLGLSSPFALAGLEPERAAELPQLTLEVLGSAELSRRWSGHGRASVWRGRLRDGSELVVRRGREGTALFEHDAARFLLIDGGETLLCAAEGDSWHGLLLEKVLPKVALMRGHEGLHAAAVESAAGVVAIVGESGAGKSTIAAELARRGCEAFADDVLIVGRRAGGVLAYPDRRRAGETVGLVCLLSRATGLVLEAEQLRANPLVLAPYMLGFTGDGERQRARFELYSDLLGRARTVMLTADAADPPGDLAELIEVEIEGIARGRRSGALGRGVRGRGVSTRPSSGRLLTGAGS